MKNFFKIIPLLVFGYFFSCVQANKKSNTNDDLSTFNADSMKHDLAIIASDSFLGRKPFTEGETKTIKYLQARYKEIGLEPGNGQSYLEPVPMVSVQATAAPSMDVKSDKNNFKLKAFDDYVIWTDKTDSSISLVNTPLVFVGYGVVAPEYNWNDYAGLDVKGKVVLVMVNDPGFWVGDTTLSKAMP